jgi:methyl-accepting chemotaxis protein
VRNLDRKDEIGVMARAVQVFKENAQQLKLSEEERGRLSETTERQRAESERERIETAAHQSQVVESLAEGLERLSQGDLTFRLTQQFAPAYEKLRADYNAAVEKLSDSMSVLLSSVGVIRTGAQQITSAADDLSQRTEQQAASLEEAAAALDEITATVRHSAQGATHAREVVGTAKSDVERSREVVREAVDAMSGIEGFSHQISQIVGVIDEIAFQTNLLALNAGVEAARAGESGKGFAVVASEVRALAQRSAEAAKEIKVLISSSGEQVNLGVKLVGQTGAALETIVSKVNEISELVSDMATAAQEQMSSITEVNSAVTQMDQVTQRNAAMVEESTAASHGLAAETHKLSELVSLFNVGDVVQHAQAGAPARPRSRRTNARAPTYEIERGGAVRVTQAEAENGWEEF